MAGLARSAYRSSQTLPAQPGTEAGKDFTEMLAEASRGALETVRTGEATAAAGLRGEVGTQEVVEAVLAMESTVKVAVSLRDRFVQAYQEILRMPI